MLSIPAGRAVLAALETDFFSVETEGRLLTVPLGKTISN